jgi:hypothetical protein
MPYYNFKDKETGEERTEFMKISELDSFIESNQNLEQIIGTPLIIDPTKLMGMMQKDSGWKEVLTKIRDGNKGSTINVEGL